MSRLRTLRWRLALLYAALAAVVLVIVLLVTSAAVESALVKTTADRLEIEAGLITAKAGGGPRGPRATDLAASDLAGVLGGNGTAVVILDADGLTVASESNGAPAPILAARLPTADYAAVIADGRSIRGVLPGDSGGRVLVVAAPVQLRTTGSGNGNGSGNGIGRGLGNQKPGKGQPVVVDGPANAVAQLAVSLDSVDSTLGDLRSTTAILGIVLLLAAAGGALVLTSAGLRPLDRIAATADRIAGGDLGARASLRGGDDEVGRLARAFDGMADRVDTTLQAQRQFAADASHELRSPLTVLGGYVDVLARQEIDAETRARTLAAMRREIDRLSRLSSDLLLLTQLEAGGDRSSPRPVDLGDLVEDIGAAAAVIGPDRRIDVVRDGPLPVVADPDRLTQALMNLVDNAVRHSPAGAVIRISARSIDGKAVAEISNEGDPIAPDDLNHVFDRFYRASNGSTGGSGRESQGHAGLGLAIVKAIAESAGGSASVASDTTGTRFTLELPQVRPTG
jgi:two-component system OmpR family sensor kinase